MIPEHEWKWTRPEHGGEILIGMDEVGLGPVFGPLVVSAVANTNKPCVIEDVKDSKSYGNSDKGEKERRIAADRVCATTPHETVFAYAASIEYHGYAQALRLAFKQCLEGLIRRLKLVIPDPQHRLQTRLNVTIDGTAQEDSETYIDGFPVVIRSIPKADRDVYEVSAASIIAKVARDRWIYGLTKQEPHLDEKYDLNKNKGYPTARHIDGLIQYGLDARHRRSACETAITNRKKKQEEQTHARTPAQPQKTRGPHPQGQFGLPGIGGR